MRVLFLGREKDSWLLCRKILASTFAVDYSIGIEPETWPRYDVILLDYIPEKKWLDLLRTANVPYTLLLDPYPVPSSDLLATDEFLIKAPGYASYICQILPLVVERFRMEKALQESRALMQDVLDNSPSLVYIVGADGRFLLANQPLAKLLGVARELVVGQARESFLPKDIAHRHRQNDLQVIRDGHPTAFEEENVQADGRHVYATIKFPLRDPQGRIYAVGGMSTDITERKRTEESLSVAMADLERSNKELEQFAYVASHDLQEPLRKVASFTQLLAERYGDKLDADAKDFIAYAVDGTHRMQRLIGDLLAYSRVGSRGKPFAPVDCEAVVEYCTSNLEQAIRENCAVVTHDHLPTVMGDDVQLLQLFQNLIGNAIKFHRPGVNPEVYIGVKKVIGHPSGANAAPQAPMTNYRMTNDSFWLFSVRDNGIGIDPQSFGRIFVIFQRLHSRSEYPGTGIGLAISKKVVERHGGRIWVESEPGKGATFYFSIPES